MACLPFAAERFPFFLIMRSFLCASRHEVIGGELSRGVLTSPAWPGPTGLDLAFRFASSEVC